MLFATAYQTRLICLPVYRSETCQGIWISPNNISVRQKRPGSCFTINIFFQIYEFHYKVDRWWYMLYVLKSNKTVIDLLQAHYDNLEEVYHILLQILFWPLMTLPRMPTSIFCQAFFLLVSEVRCTNVNENANFYIYLAPSNKALPVSQNIYKCINRKNARFISQTENIPHSSSAVYDVYSKYCIIWYYLARFRPAIQLFASLKSPIILFTKIIFNQMPCTRGNAWPVWINIYRSLINIQP